MNRRLKLNYSQYWIYLTLLLGFVSLGALAQNDDKKDFEKMFETELSEESSKLRKEQFSLGVSEIPVWFWNIPATTDKKSYAIGISDPEMEDSLKTQKQALQRALMQLCLMKETCISGVSDLYNRDLQNKYEEYYKILGDSCLQGSIVVIDSFKTRYGEKMLLVALDRSRNNQFRIKAGIETYKSNTKIEIGWCSSEKINYYARTDSDSMGGEYEQDSEQTSMLSIWNGDTISIDAYRYEYESMRADTPTDASDSIIKLYHKGLWIGYFQAFLNGLQAVTANQRSRLKAMSEFHTQSTVNENLNSINRNVVNSKITFSIRTISTLYNQLNIDFYIYQSNSKF